MADFEAPAGPPPPKVPEGWVVRWNEQYKEWFYVNTYTKKSQWEKPTEPAVPPRDDLAPSGPPPSYTPGDGHTPAPSDTKSTSNPFETTPNQGQGAAASYINNSTPNLPTSNATGGPTTSTEDEDARLARQLQAEEDARAAAASAPPVPAPYSQPQGGASSPFPGQLPPRPEDKGRGLLGKLFGGGKKPGFGGSSGHGGGGLPGALGGLMGSHGSGGQHGYPQQQYPPPQQGYGGYGAPAQGGGYYPPQQGGYYPPQQQPYGGGYQGGYYPPQQGAYGSSSSGHKKSSGMGMMAGGAALGVGAGLLGGVLVADAIGDAQEDAYQEGFADGADFEGGDF